MDGGGRIAAGVGLRRVGEVGVGGGGAEGMCEYRGIMMRLGMGEVC